MAITIGALTKAAGEFNAAYQTSYTRTYRVRSSDRSTEGETQIMAAMLAAGITMYSPHPSDSRALVQRISAEAIKQYNQGSVRGMLWDVTVEYGPVNPLNVITGGDPTAQAVRFRFDPITFDRPIFSDFNGEPIRASSQEPFDPGATEEVTRYQITVMRNEVGISIPTLMEISSQSRVNDATWNGLPAGTVKLLPFKIPERQWSQETNQLYYPMEYVFNYDAEGWKFKVLDQGVYQLKTISSVTKQVAINDGMGQPVTRPVPLNGSGVPLAIPVDSSTVHYLEFDVCEPMDFSVLNLGSLF